MGQHAENPIILPQVCRTLNILTRSSSFTRRSLHPDANWVNRSRLLHDIIRKCREPLLVKTSCFFLGNHFCRKNTKVRITRDTLSYTHVKSCTSEKKYQLEKISFALSGRKKDRHSFDQEHLCFSWRSIGQNRSSE